MRKTKPISVTLTPELAEGVKSRVELGEYASDSEVVRAGLRALFAREEAEHQAYVEHWLQTEGRRRIEAFHADPTRGVPAAEVFAKLREQVRKHGDS
jgi:putative addiction module CopG family antidote